jgi:cysteinyl-tRNA synthetase
VEREFNAELGADFHTPKAMAILFNVVRRGNRALTQGDAGQARACAASVRRLGQVLGLFQDRTEAVLRPAAKASQPAADNAAIEALVAERDLARRQRDFAAADRIRLKLSEMGIVVDDRPDGGSTWRKRG